MKTQWIIHEWKDPDGVVERLLRSGATQFQLLNSYPERFIEEKVVHENLLPNEGI